MRLTLCLSAVYVGVCLAACSPPPDEPSLPRLSISCVDPLNNQYKQPCRLRYRSRRDRFSMPIRIKRRGGWSIQFAKHSYSMELGQRYPLAGLPLEDDWILNANYIDKTFLRHTLSYDLFREMHPENVAPRYAYVLVDFNDEPQGLYVLMERLDAKRLELRKRNGAGLICKDPPVFHHPASVPDSANYFHQKFPDPAVANFTEYLHDWRAFLFGASDSLFRAKISQQVDLRNIIDWHLLLLLTNNNDGVKKNFYLYRRSVGAPFRIAPWDYDHSFGRDGDNEYNFLERRVEPYKSVLLHRLMQTGADNYPRRLRDRWFELRRELLAEDQLLQRIDRMRTKIEPFIPFNRSLWPDDGPGYYDSRTFGQEVQLIKDYLRVRLPELDSLLSRSGTDSLPR